MAMQCCPNYDPLAEAQLAAPPLAVRKGCAFPLRDTSISLIRAAPMNGIGAARMKRKGVRPDGRAEPFRTARGKAPSNANITH
jgi:hypothetical protein